MTGNLLVVTIDRLPGWMLPAYGSTWVSMPGLDALAGRGVVLDGLVATDDEPRETIAGLFGGPGWPLAAALEPGVLVTDDAAMAESMAGILDTRHVAALATAATAVDDDDTNLARLFAAATAIVAAGQHRLVWCHAGSLAVAWDAPPEYREALLDPEDPPPPAGAAVPDLVVTTDTDPDLLVGIRHVCAGQLALLDTQLAQLLAAAAEGWTILVVGVRGMPLGLHGRVGSGPIAPYGELVRMPAILVDAQGRMAGQRSGGLAVPMDLGMTLSDLLAGRVSASDQPPHHARSLAGLFTEWTAAARDRVIVVGAEGTAVITPGWHLILPAAVADGRRPRLFAKPDDFFELCDVADRCPDVVDELLGVAEAAAAGDLERAWGMPLSEAATGAN
ncbi:MAG: hypothetical protein K8S94_09290 [Planctomycetia bacterium]|nr:hypothetical protein [Planctomycetia bacterium]